MTANNPPVTPITPSFNYAEAKDKDIALYKAWKAEPTKANMGKLVHQLKPMISSEVNKLMGSVPPAALHAEAMKWTIHAIKTYDPDKGAALSTHVGHWLQKVKRLNYKTQNAARLAENQQLSYREYNLGRQELSAQLNREPTPQELATHLNWGVKQVNKFQRELFNDFYESGSDYSPEFTTFDSNKVQWDYVKENLSPEEKKLLDLLIKAESPGTKMNSGEIAAELGVNINRYNYLRRKLVDKMHGLQKEIGEF